MTLLISVFAAVIATAVWYIKKDSRLYKVGWLVWMYWGASLMWLVDAIAGFIEEKADTAAFFGASEEMALEDMASFAYGMLNDAFLGLAVVALGLVVWVLVLLIKDPTGRVKEALRRKK